jgi:regulator of protease activity HflC (stomatin/prohibitin superfamily)
MVCCTTVETGSVKIVERCGRFSGILTPGLSFLIPCFDVPTNPLSMRLQQIEVACETKTKDNVFTHMKVSISSRLLTTTLQFMTRTIA